MTEYTLPRLPAQPRKPFFAAEHGQGQPGRIDHAVNRQAVRGYRWYAPLRRPRPDEKRRDKQRQQDAAGGLNQGKRFLPFEYPPPGKGTGYQKRPSAVNDIPQRPFGRPTGIGPQQRLHTAPKGSQYPQLEGEQKHFVHRISLSLAQSHRRRETPFCGIKRSGEGGAGPSLGEAKREGLPLGKGTLRFLGTAHTPKGKKPDGPFP